MQKLVTIFELATRNELELQAMFREVSEALPQTKSGSADRRNVLTSLENIARVIHDRNAFKP